MSRLARGRKPWLIFAASCQPGNRGDVPATSCRSVILTYRKGVPRFRYARVAVHGGLDMKSSFTRRVIAVLVAVMVTNGVGLHAAMLPALAGNSPHQEATTPERSQLSAHHAACLRGLKCPLCAYSSCKQAAIVPAEATLDEGARPLFVWLVPQGNPVTASNGGNTRIRAPPLPLFPS